MSQRCPEPEPEPEIQSSGTAEVIAADHTYACEPDTMKRKYHDTLEKLDKLQTDLYNTKRREKRAKVSVGKLLQELTEQKKILEEAKLMLQAYKG